MFLFAYGRTYVRIVCREYESWCVFYQMMECLVPLLVVIILSYNINHKLKNKIINNLTILLSFIRSLFIILPIFAPYHLYSKAFVLLIKSCCGKFLRGSRSIPIFGRLKILLFLCSFVDLSNNLKL